MKKCIFLLLLAAAGLSVQAQSEKYEAEMEQMEIQAKAIINEYKAIREKDPKGEQPSSKARALQLSNKLDSLQAAHKQLVLRIVRENRNNQIPVPYIKKMMYDLSFEEMGEVLNPQAAYYDNPELANVKMIYEGMKKRLPGQKFHELAMNDLKGQPVTLSQWAGRGNYVLIDFWASWCGPCCQEMPNVVANYKKYHADGFEVVGVSFDQKEDAWVKAVKQLEMEWPQMSDLKGWQCAAASTYGIFSIPSSILLDPQGTIIAVNLRGPALGEKLKEIYGK